MSAQFQNGQFANAHFANAPFHGVVIDETPEAGAGDAHFANAHFANAHFATQHFHGVAGAVVKYNVNQSSGSGGNKGVVQRTSYPLYPRKLRRELTPVELALILSEADELL